MCMFVDEITFFFTLHDYVENEQYIQVLLLNDLQTNLFIYLLQKEPWLSVYLQDTLRGN